MLRKGSGSALLSLLALVVFLTPVGLPAAGRADPPAPRTSNAERARQLFEAGVAAYEAGRLDEALAKLREAHQLMPLPELVYNIARVYERMSDAANAIRWFETYLRTPDLPAGTRQEIERKMAALRDLERRQREQIFTAPPSTDEMTAEAARFFRRGVSMFRRGEFEAALQAFIAAHQFAPDQRELLFNVAVTNERLERLQDAIDFYREYLRADRTAPDRATIERKLRELRERLDSTR